MCLLFCSSCAEKHNAYAHYETLPAKGWAYGDTVTIMPCGLNPGAGPRDIRLGICFDTDYKYSDAIIELSFPIGSHIRRDTVELRLTDRFGIWRGKGLGTVHQIDTVLTYGHEFRDSVPVTLRHVMRVDTLRGINRIGVTIFKP